MPRDISLNATGGCGVVQAGHADAGRALGDEVAQVGGGLQVEVEAAPPQAVMAQAQQHTRRVARPSWVLHQPHLHGWVGYDPKVVAGLPGSRYRRAHVGAGFCDVQDEFVNGGSVQPLASQQQASIRQEFGLHGVSARGDVVVDAAPVGAQEQQHAA